MTEWLRSFGSTRASKKSEDNFWADFLKKEKNHTIKFNRKLAQCPNKTEGFQPNYSFSSDRLQIEPTFDRRGYRQNVFGKIFNKKFEARAVNSLKKSTHSQSLSTYHFCQK